MYSQNLSYIIEKTSYNCDKQKKTKSNRINITDWGKARKIVKKLESQM